MDPSSEKAGIVEEKEYEPPIVISEADGQIHISYDQVKVDIPEEGPVPSGTPPLARRVFKALVSDFSGYLRAE